MMDSDPLHTPIASIITPDPGGWALPGSILAGSLLLAVFEPTMLLISIGALIWLGFLRRSTLKQFQTLQSRTRILEQRLAQSHTHTDRLASILDSADVPIIATNHAGSIIQANQAASNILGSGRSLIGEFFDALITQDAVRELEHHARQGESGHARLQLPVGGEMRVFDVAADPIPSTQGAVCTFTDITELSESATLKADFAANASHELRTPIASILGAIQTMEGPASNDPDMIQRLITMISTNATRLDLMVKDLLDLSKLESTTTPIELTQINIAQIIEHTIEPLAAICQRRNLTIDPQIDPQAATFISDESLLELILRNLIGNATKFAHESTTITIRINPSSAEPDPESTPPKPPKGLTGSMGVRISVRDQGVGIPLSQQTRIFERFYQVDEARDGAWARRGTGLGLAIVKHAARTLGGTIRVESIHQQGTTMVVELPGCL